MLFSVFILAILLTSLIGARNVIAAHLQGIAWLLTGKKRLGLMLYSVIFLPGVVIHEISHFFMAAFLGVRTGEITIFPSGSAERGTQRLGSVKMARADFIRSSLIGVAPLVFGSIFIIALSKWQFPQLLESVMVFDNTLNQFLIEGKRIVSEPLNFIWIYLVFAVSNTMFVSSSDRRSWPALILLLVLLTLISIWVGLASPITQKISPPLFIGINILTAAFFISLVIDVVFLAPILVIEKLVSRLKKRQIDYKKVL